MVRSVCAGFGLWAALAGLHGLGVTAPAPSLLTLRWCIVVAFGVLTALYTIVSVITDAARPIPSTVSDDETTPAVPQPA